jgi:hypothetical protein
VQDKARKGLDLVEVEAEVFGWFGSKETREIVMKWRQEDGESRAK